jgi:hypothetical protein
MPSYAVLCLLVLSSVPGAQDDGFRSLFNGQNLEGWKVCGGKAEKWAAEEGTIVCLGGGGGWLMTTQEYADYELRLEYKMSKMSNSGVALRAPEKGDPAYVGMEIQLIDDENWPGLQSWQHTGSIYDVVPAAKQANKPIGEWNQMKIVAKGTRITVELNGETLVDADLADYKDRLEDNKETKKRGHPGLGRTKGHIGFQSYNTRVEFRHIKIKEISSQ